MKQEERKALSFVFSVLLGEHDNNYEGFEILYSLPYTMAFKYGKLLPHVGDDSWKQV